MRHIFDHQGVHYDVRYQPGDPPTFESVRLLGANYQPTGPELLLSLHDLAILSRDEEGGVTLATRFLSAIVEELPK